MAAVFFILIGATVYLFGAVSKGFIPDEDNDSMMVTLEAAQGTSYYKMVDYVTQVANIMRQDPNIDSFMSNADTTNTPRFWVQLKPRKMRAAVASAGDRRIAAQGLRISGRKGLPGRAAQPAFRRASDQVGVRFHAARAGHRSALRAGAEAGARDREAARAWWMSRRTCK